jgi:DNA-binding transcriptional ArsR family regulator
MRAADLRKSKPVSATASREARIMPPAVADWTFLTNHAHVLLCVSRDPQARLRDVADAVGITERAAQRIVAELEAGGYLTRIREGRRNRYEIHADVPLRHPVEREHAVGEILAVLRPSRGASPASQPGSA